MRVAVRSPAVPVHCGELGVSVQVPPLGAGIVMASLSVSKNNNKISLVAIPVGKAGVIARVPAAGLRLLFTNQGKADGARAREIIPFFVLTSCSTTVTP